MKANMNGCLEERPASERDALDVCLSQVFSDSARQADDLVIRTAMPALWVDRAMPKSQDHVTTAGGGPRAIRGDLWCPACEERIIFGQLTERVEARDIPGTLLTVHAGCRKPSRHLMDAGDSPPSPRWKCQGCGAHVGASHVVWSLLWGDGPGWRHAIGPQHSRICGSAELIRADV